MFGEYYVSQDILRKVRFVQFRRNVDIGEPSFHLNLLLGLDSVLE